MMSREVVHCEQLLPFFFQISENKLLNTIGSYPRITPCEQPSSY